MRYLGLALYREGTTDQRFFEPLLRRAVIDACVRHGHEPVEVGDVIELPARPLDRGKGLVDKVCSAAKAYEDSFDLLFLHTDSGNDPDGAYTQRIEPAFSALRQVLRERQRPVAIVPVREMEAWTLVDGDALRAAFGSSRSDDEMGIPPRPPDVERLIDPKATLDHVFQSILGRRRPHARAAAYLTQIGEHVRLERLREVPAYQRFEQALVAALGELHVIAPTHRRRAGS